jgi:hypothetical protein
MPNSRCMWGTSASAPSAHSGGSLHTPNVCGATQLRFVYWQLLTVRRALRDTTMTFPGRLLVLDLGVLWAPLANGDPASGAAYVDQQLYVLSKSDRMWGLWTHCAACPSNSFSPAGSTASTPGINACKCSDNYYGILSRPVIDQCVACRIKFEANGVTVSPGSVSTTCHFGYYKTNTECKSTNPNRSVDTTCALCYASCRPGDA